MPTWFVVITASKYLGVEPWELAKMPLSWTLWALEHQSITATAQEQRQDLERKRHGY